MTAFPVSDQLIAELGSPVSNTREISSGATRHGRNLFFRGLTVSQVVHDYGDIVSRSPIWPWNWARTSNPRTFAR